MGVFVGERLQASQGASLDGQSGVRLQMADEEADLVGDVDDGLRRQPRQGVEDDDDEGLGWVGGQEAAARWRRGGGGGGRRRRAGEENADGKAQLVVVVHRLENEEGGSETLGFQSRVDMLVKQPTPSTT